MSHIVAVDIRGAEGVGVKVDEDILAFGDFAEVPVALGFVRRGRESIRSWVGVCTTVMERGEEEVESEVG